MRGGLEGDGQVLFALGQDDGPFELAFILVQVGGFLDVEQNGVALDQAARPRRPGLGEGDERHVLRRGHGLGL